MVSVPESFTLRDPPEKLVPLSAAIEDVVPVVQRNATFAEPVASTATDGSIEPPLLPSVKAVGPAELNLQLPVTVAETFKVLVVLLAEAGATATIPAATAPIEASFMNLISLPYVI